MIETAKQIVGHHDPTWWAVGAVFFGLVYGLSDETVIAERTKVIYRYTKFEK